MATFHLRHSFIGRSRGASVIAKAAYNAGEKLEDNNGSTKYSDYTRKGGVLYDEICLPKGTPTWANDRGELWRRLEAREDKSTRRASAVLAHSFDISLPHELTLEQNIFLARDFVREQFVRKGYAADWSIHAPDPRGDERNIHLHILTPLRQICGESYGIKDRYPKSKLSAQVKTWRGAWATLANRHLKRYGHSAEIDERSLKGQGVKRTPTKPKGVRAKMRRAALDTLRKPQPRSPVVRMSSTVGNDGSITVRAAIIAHSALNKAAERAFEVKPMKPTRSSDWPKEAIDDWVSWGFRDVPRFFAKWPQLAPPDYKANVGRPS